MRLVRAAAAALAVAGAAGCSEREPSGARAPDEAQRNAALDAAETYWRSGDFPRAEAILAVLIERAPQSWEAHEMPAQVLIACSLDEEEAGRDEAARSVREEAYGHLERAIELNDRSAPLHQGAGILASMLGRSEVALAHFERAMLLDPGSAQAALYGAQMAIAIAETDRARGLLERTLAIDPDDPHARATLALLHAGEGRFDEALAAIAEAIRLEPRNSALRVQHARIVRQAGDARRAAEILLLLPEEDSRDPALAEELSGLLMEIGEPARAGRALARALDGRPDAGTWQQRVRACEAFLEAGDPEESLRWAFQARDAGAPAEVVGELVRRAQAAASRSAAGLP